MATQDGEEESTLPTSSSSWRSLLETTIAKTRKIRGSNYVQVSTVTETGEPRCRTVVFRGFVKFPTEHAWNNDCGALSCGMKLCTDARSQKVAQTAHQSIAELVWWFPTTSEQYRIRGTLRCVGEGGEDCLHNNTESSSSSLKDQDKLFLERERKQLWGNLSDPARESFLQDPAIVPGEVYAESEAQQASLQSPPPPGGRDPEGKLLPPPPSFLLMLLDPFHVDYLRLSRGQYRQVDSKKSTATHNDDKDDCTRDSSSSNWSWQRVNP
jgi:pyridoxamine 5'-phosphate oxidase